MSTKYKHEYYFYNLLMCKLKYRNCIIFLEVYTDPDTNLRQSPHDHGGVRRSLELRKKSSDHEYFLNN